MLAETEIVTRHMTIVNVKGGTESVIVEDVADDSEIAGEKTPSSGKEHLRIWWQPVLKMKFDDPEQEAPFWVATNNVVLNTPFPGIQIKAFALVNGSRIGVFLSGPRRANILMIQKYLKRERMSLLNELPTGTEITTSDCSIGVELASDDEKRAWIMKTLNAFANVLRPRLKRWYQEAHQ